MWRKIQEVHPALAEAGKFIDWQRYRPWPVTVCNDDGVCKVNGRESRTRE
jgi:hypothetical protein